MKESRREESENKRETCTWRGRNKGGKRSIKESNTREKKGGVKEEEGKKKGK